MSFGKLVRKAIAKVQSGGVLALAPFGVGLGHSARRGWRDTVDFEFEALDQLAHLHADTAPLGNNERFRNRCG